MNVRLSPHSEQLIKERLANGSYSSPEEVIEHALEALSGHENAIVNLNSADFEAALDDLAQGSDKLPVLPPEATNRDGIYRQHN